MRIDPGPESRVLELIEKLRPDAEKRGLRISWTRRENIHLTLKFLGATPIEKLDILQNEIASVCSGFSVFRMHLRGVGAFPGEARPRSLWCGVEEGSQILVELAGKIDEVLKVHGFEPENRKFSAHLTIGRVKGGKGGVADLLEPFRKLDFGDSTVRSVILFESVTRKTGSEYSKVAEFLLSERKS